MIGNSYRKSRVRASMSPNSNYGNIEEMSEDLRNDLKIAFNLFKNNEEKLSKLKLRTILFSFAMYKSAPKDINDYISEYFPKKEEFTFEDLWLLVYQKMKLVKEREAEDLYYIIAGGRNVPYITTDEIDRAFHENGVDITDKEIFDMVDMIDYLERRDETLNKEEFKKFAI